jgi:hypothetical protein
VPPVSFGYKCSWLAIKGLTPEKIIELLPVRDAQVADWSEGIAAAYEGQTFVSPSVDGWVLVVSTVFSSFSDQPSSFVEWLAAVSRRIDAAVQLFVTHRVVEYHAWCWADRGKVVRAYGWCGESGETVIDLGRKSKAEEERPLHVFDDVPAEEGQEDKFVFPDEEYLLQLAGRWSINPAMLEENHPELGPGWLGSVSVGAGA